ncbi:MAG: hypothetical protein FE78DRAFT_472340 [Acidomyces sp. 'richmondensis']|nr:MAG: hypothetical protein FE78DRAFT_472340 [Acidomyces sp. 'richmondensis']
MFTLTSTGHNNKKNILFSCVTRTSQKPIKLNKSRIKAIYRIGPHDKDVLCVLVCGMLGD